MAVYPIEIYSKILFDEELTFEEVEEAEKILVSEFQQQLALLEAEHIDFFNVEDGIQIHFSLKNSSLIPIKKACNELQAVLQNLVSTDLISMKLTVINRELTGMYLCSITRKSLEDKVVRLF